MTNGEKFKDVFGFGADGSRVIAELSEKIMFGSEAGEFIDIADVHAYNDTIRKLYDSGEWEK